MLIPKHRCMHTDNMKRSYVYKTADSLYLLVNAQSLDEYITSVSILADRAKTNMKVFSIGTKKIHELLYELGYVRHEMCRPLTYNALKCEEHIKRYINDQFKDFCWIPILKHASTDDYEGKENSYTSEIANPWLTITVNDRAGHCPGRICLRTFASELGDKQVPIDHAYYHCKKWNSFPIENSQTKRSSVIERL